MTSPNNQTTIKSIGIIVPANVRGGPEKASAILATSLAEQGHKVSIFVPLLPWYFYFVALRKNPLRWLRYAIPNLKRWIRTRKFAFSELLEKSEGRDRISVQFVARYASKKQLEGLDCLFLDSIAQVSDYSRRYDQHRQIYTLWHPEEYNHGHSERFKALRKDFSGKILVASPVIAKSVSDHVIDPPLVPAPISPNLWEQRGKFDTKEHRKDILLLWKDNQQGKSGSDIVRALQGMRPDTSVTVWCWGIGARDGAQTALPNATIVENFGESELKTLYLSHSLLIFPSIFEGFGMPPIEALACGCIPVLRPEVGAAELYAKDGENAIFMNDDHSAIARRISDFLENTELIQSMRRAAPASVHAFDPHTYGPRMLEAAGVTW